MEGLENLDSKQKTISMPDPPNKLSTFVPRESQRVPESVYPNRNIIKLDSGAQSKLKGHVKSLASLFQLLQHTNSF